MKTENSTDKKEENPLETELYNILKGNVLSDENVFDSCEKYSSVIVKNDFLLNGNRINANPTLIKRKIRRRSTNNKNNESNKSPNKIHQRYREMEEAFLQYIQKTKDRTPEEENTFGFSLYDAFPGAFALEFESNELQQCVNSDRSDFAMPSTSSESNCHNETFKRPRLFPPKRDSNVRKVNPQWSTVSNSNPGPSNPRNELQHCINSDRSDSAMPSTSSGSNGHNETFKRPRLFPLKRDSNGRKVNPQCSTVSNSNPGPSNPRRINSNLPLPSKGQKIFKLARGDSPSRNFCWEKPKESDLDIRIAALSNPKFGNTDTCNNLNERNLIENWNIQTQLQIKRLKIYRRRKSSSETLEYPPPYQEPLHIIFAANPEVCNVLFLRNLEFRRARFQPGFPKYISDILKKQNLSLNSANSTEINKIYDNTILFVPFTKSGPDSKKPIRLRNSMPECPPNQYFIRCWQCFKLMEISSTPATGVIKCFLCREQNQSLHFSKQSIDSESESGISIT
ncbi:UNVERIFIED_CONTAM: hypothetical protein RMT77_004749 [Armadillidium vulgare]